MLVRDRMVNVHRATEDDARAVASLHATVERAQLALVRGRDAASGVPIDQDEQIWRGSLRLTNGDHRPWIAWRGDTAIGFVTSGPSRDAAAGPKVGELYVFDVDVHETGGSVASTLLDHACRDLARHGFRDVTMWVSSRDACTRELVTASGWIGDGARRFERVHGVPVLQFRYRKSLD